MDTNFNTVIYQLEMQSLVNTAIKKLTDNGLRLRGKRRPL